MPTVETSIWIKAPVEKVFGIAKESERYPEYMKDVQSVTIVEREGGRVVADYVAMVPQFRLKVRWQQEELWNESEWGSKFRQLEGDYDRLEGTWKFIEENGGTRFDQYLEYDYNVPTLGPLVKKVIHGIVVNNLKNTGEAIKARAES